MDAFTCNPQIEDDQIEDAEGIEDEYAQEYDWDDDQALEAYSLECAFGPDC
jgi:hypothetical protein